jgi:hypothetical protein
MSVLLYSKNNKAFLLTDIKRVDYVEAAHRLPASAYVIVRHTDILKKHILYTQMPFFKRVISLPTRRLYPRVHIPENILKQRGRYPWLKYCRFKTASAHSAAAVMRARRAGVDYCLISPVFRTDSHPSAKPLGLYRFRALARLFGKGAVALGGINQRNMGLFEHVAGVRVFIRDYSP